jgi:hypothetical protein
MGSARIALFCFFVNDVPTHKRVIFTQFETSSGITTVLFRVVHMTALGATHFNQQSVSLFCHDNLSVSVTLNC